MKTWRRLVSLAVVAGCAAGVLLLSESGKTAVSQEVNDASAKVQEAFPHVVNIGAISSSWYCPGVYCIS